MKLTALPHSPENVNVISSVPVGIEAVIVIVLLCKVVNERELSAFVSTTIIAFIYLPK
jgi:hypothetical protein